MTFAVDGPCSRRLALRVGIVFSNRLVEERLFRAGDDVSLGTNPRCDLLLPMSAPAAWRLFRWQRRRWQLRLDRSMRGRVAAGNTPRELSPGENVVLFAGTRGRLVVQDTTVLFQVVALPELARPRLPSSMRSSALALVDRSFAAVLAVSFTLHLAFVLALKGVDWPHTLEDDIVEIERGFLRQVRPAPATPEPLQGSPAPGPKSSAKPAVARKSAPAPTDDRRALVEKVGRMGLLAVLTARRNEGSGVVRDLLGDGNVERSQEAALAGVRGVELASADARPAPTWTHGSGTIADVRGISNLGSSIAVASTGSRDERRVPRVRAEAPIVDSDADGQIDEALLLREVRGRLGAVRACYERALKHNPNLAGKLLLHLTVSAAGTVSALDVASDSMEDQEMTACMRGLIVHWRFPGSGSAPVEISLPFVFQPAL